MQNSKMSWLRTGCRKVELVIATFCIVTLLFPRAASAKDKVDVLVTGGTVVTMDGQRRVIEDGAVAIRGDLIVAVGSRA